MTNLAATIFSIPATLVHTRLLVTPNGMYLVAAESHERLLEVVEKLEETK